METDPEDEGRGEPGQANWTADVEGPHPDAGIVAAEHLPGKEDAVLLFRRVSGKLEREQHPFTPFCWLTEAGLLDGSGLPATFRSLSGRAPLRRLALFPSWKTLRQAVAHLKQATGFTPSTPRAPFFLINDPVQQFLMLTGRTFFKDLPFPALKRMQVDIETLTGEGYDFPNPRRESDRIIAIALGDESGWVEVLSGRDLDEKELLTAFVRLVRERDPDVIEGHNMFRFDWPYLIERARRHGVRLALGRDGADPRVSPSRFTAGDQVMNYPKVEVFGRQLVDTFFLAHIHDVSNRSLEGFGLKEVAVHFGLAAPGRTHIAGGDISRVFRDDPERLAAYARDDIVETRALGALLSPVHFIQARLLPFSYQQVSLRGQGARIDALLLRDYLSVDQAIPWPDAPRPFAGGYTDLFYEGLAHNVHHCDVRSLYPSLMLKESIAPHTDERGVFLDWLRRLRAVRLEAKRRAQRSRQPAERRAFEAFQTSFKILINSFYGYLGFAQGRFNDYSAAERVTAAGRELLRNMIDWVRRQGGQPIEIDTDGMYFIPPPFDGDDGLERFREAFRAWLPEGIEIEFDDVYPAMVSYKMKNYALLTADGEVQLTGAALKSRGLEPFQRDFLREVFRLKLSGREDRLPELKEEYARAIREGAWPIERLAKTETLSETPASYQAKLASGKGRRSAVGELAVRSKRRYEAGDRISYYVTGAKKSVAAHEAARLAAEWNPEHRDENVPYYLAKLDALYRRFALPEQEKSAIDPGA